MSVPAWHGLRGARLCGVMQKVLIGNAFPLSLVRKGTVAMACRPVEELRRLAQASVVVSYWGHENTRRLAEDLLGVSLKPRTARPALRLAPDGRPLLDGETFETCWVLSPDYKTGRRPAVGEEVGPDEIAGWQVVRISWT